MAFIVDGKDCDTVIVDGKDCDTVVIDGVEVWHALIAGNVTIDYNAISGDNTETVTGANGIFTFTPPKGVRNVTICMCGGGHNGWRDGGYAGEIISGNYSISRDPIAITIGKGGANAVEAPRAGSPTVFGSYATAAGGTSSYFHGDGQVRTSCGGTFTNGIRTSQGHRLGGQAGAFGNGGNSNYRGGGGNGDIGAGGGGVSDTRYSNGAGGNGRIVIKWGEE